MKVMMRSSIAQCRSHDLRRWRAVHGEDAALADEPFFGVPTSRGLVS